MRSPARSGSRRLLAVLAVAVAATAQSPALGVDLSGDLSVDMAGVCGALDPIPLAGHPPMCTHGPDPAPPGVDPSQPQPLFPATSEPQSYAATAPAPAKVPCYGDGTSGNRVQAVYTYSADRADRYASVVGSIVRWAAEADAVVNTSAKQTGGVRHVRFVTDASCNLVVLKVRLSAVGDDTIQNTIAELAAQGHNRPDRKYLVWNDSTVLCGVASTYIDDRDSQSNANNGTAPGQVARIDSGCWGLASRGQSIEAHELLHALGAVQASAPHATEQGHCTDDADRMCYDDGSPGIVVQAICGTSQEALLDCRHDDYFSTAPPAGSYLATHWNTADSSFLATTEPDPASPPPPAPAPPPTSPSPSPSPSPSAGGLPLPVLPLPIGSLNSGAVARHDLLTPARLLDTRTGTGGRKAPMRTGETYAFPAAGAGGVPAGGVGGVVLNLTVTAPTSPGALTVWPAGAERPTQPNLHFAAGATRPVAVTVPVGDDGRVAVHSTAAAAHVVVDVVGWYDDGSGAAASKFSPLPPTRLLDTRNGTGGRATALGAAGGFALQVTGRGGVPAAGVAGVVLNVTVTGPTGSGYLTTYPTGAARPLASSLNFVRGQTVPNLVVVGVGDGGRVSFFNSSGQTHVVADVVGWFDNGSEGAVSDFSPAVPATVLDTRDGTGGRTRPVGAGETLVVPVVDQGDVPRDGVGGVVLTVSAFTPTSSSYLTVYPAGSTRPTASNLNYVKGAGADNLVVVPVGADGAVTLYQHSGTAHVRVVVVGWFDAGG